MSGHIYWPLRSEVIREVDDEDMRRARVGEGYWGVTLSEIPDEVPHKVPITKYLSSLSTMVDQGKNLLLTGPYGSGKTSCGVLAIKECIGRGGRALFVEAREMTSLVIDKVETLDGQLVADRMEYVHVLVIDDLAQEHVKEFGKSVIEGVFRKRAANRRPTIITSNSDFSALEAKFKAGLQVLKKSTTVVRCSGVDWRA